MTIFLIALIVILLLVILWQKINTLTLSALLTKNKIEPTETEVKECSDYVIKRLLGQKPKL